MITKSGSNTPHGSFFGQFREQQFNALNYFEKGENGGTGQKSPYSRQVFGGVHRRSYRQGQVVRLLRYRASARTHSLTESGTPYSELVLAEPIGAQAGSRHSDALF